MEGQFITKKLENGTLEIRKTADPNHAKLYLFENKEELTECGTYPGTMITGSSNFSVTGLKNRLELNVVLRDKPSYVEGKSVFDELWDTAVAVVDEEHITDFKEKVVKHIWFEKLYSPYAMFIRVLHEYFNIPSDENILTPNDITDGTYSDLKYQTDTVQLALNSIKNHEGVIISDVVGLGKSIIASTVARNLRLRTIIVCPPHLKQQWEEYKDEFGFTASVFSSGKIEAALEHYRMIVRTDEKFLIIVDEAHKYKNEFIQDYSTLHDLCMGNKVMLLTATPFNNRPEDIYSMLKLFQIPSKSTLKMAMIHAIMGEDTKALTDEEELNAFFKERYQAELAKSEERSWDTQYRNLLNQLKGTEIHEKALQIPHRARIAREVEKPCKGVVLFGKKGNDFIFKIGANTEDVPVMLTSEQAINLFEATIDEEPMAVDKKFDEIYQHVKSNLYRSIAKDENEKSRLEAVDKLKVWAKTKVLPKDYLDDLLLIIKNDGLTGEEIRFINKQTSKTADKVQEKITQDYLNRIVEKMNRVEEGDEVLILAEQIK